MRLNQILFQRSLLTRTALALVLAGVCLMTGVALPGRADTPTAVATVAEESAAPDEVAAAADEAAPEDAAADDTVPEDSAAPEDEAASVSSEDTPDESDDTPYNAELPVVPAEEESDLPAQGTVADEAPSEATGAEPIRRAVHLEAERDPPEISPASIKGVQPGHTTRAELHEAWGDPTHTENFQHGVRETYEGGHFHRVQVIVTERVESLAIQLEKPQTIDAMAEKLHVTDLEGVDVFNERGRLVGRAFPERGVLFGFAGDGGLPLVVQVIVEGIDAQLFLARAEKRLHGRYAECMADIQQALELAPESGRVHWMHARLTLAVGDLEQALTSATKATELEPDVVEYRITLAKVCSAAGDAARALETIRPLAESTKLAPIDTARVRALCGDFTAGLAEHDYQAALNHHAHAIKLAEPLAASEQPAVRRAARELLIETNLAVAHDIGWGRWQQKSKVVPKWIERATALVDEYAGKDAGAREMRFVLCEGALAALAGVVDPPDAESWTRGATELCQALTEQATDPTYKSHLAWRLGVALANAAEIEAARQHAEPAQKLGEKALVYLEQGADVARQLPAHDFVCGRLCFRMGAIHSIEKSDHKAAVEWFDKAVPLLESPVPATMAESGKQGEMFVSMGVSYWEVENHREALRLTTQGLTLMERAAGDGHLARSALVVPYANLANMHEQLGEPREAKKYSEMAARLEGTTTR